MRNGYMSREEHCELEGVRYNMRGYSDKDMEKFITGSLAVRVMSKTLSLEFVELCRKNGLSISNDIDTDKEFFEQKLTETTIYHDDGGVNYDSLEVMVLGEASIEVVYYKKGVTDMFNIINLTPHPVTILTEEDTIIIEPSGVIPRLDEVWEESIPIDGIPTFTKSFGGIENMPKPEENTVYIVSALVALALKHRGDVFIPNDIIRDENGNIVGCRSLAKI